MTNDQVGIEWSGWIDGGLEFSPPPHPPMTESHPAFDDSKCGFYRLFAQAVKGFQSLSLTSKRQNVASTLQKTRTKNHTLFFIDSRMDVLLR